LKKFSDDGKARTKRRFEDLNNSLTNKPAIESVVYKLDTDAHKLKRSIR
jgi:hypothetical protein